MSHVRLRILHLSDLHERASRETEPWRRRRVLGDAWKSNLDALLEDGGFDLVCFTGDAADWGKPEEFQLAGEFLRAVLDRLRLSTERLYVVPGNHDIDRSVHSDVWKQVRDLLPRLDALDVARWLGGGPAPPGMDVTWRAQLLERQGAFRAWLRDDLGGRELVTSVGDPAPVGYRQTFQKQGVDVHVVGLDSSWLCGDDQDAGKLRLTDSQVMQHLTKDGDGLDGLRLVLVHHPLHELADASQVRGLLADHADLVLRGHLHAAELSTWSDPDRRLRSLASGCLYEGHRADQWPNACQAITLGLDGQGQIETAEVRLRSFSPSGGHWFDDNSLYRESREGRVRWRGRPRRRVRQDDIGSNPFRPFDLAVPPTFQGRAKELKKLEAHLDGRKGVSVVGDGRIGKTSLLRTWQYRLAARGRTVFYLDGQGPEGESEIALVRHVTGRQVNDDASSDQAANVLSSWAQSMPPGLPPVLLIDKFDHLPERFAWRFFDRLKNLLGQIVLVLASKRGVDELYRDLRQESPFQTLLSFLRLSLLDEMGAEGVIALGEAILDDEDARQLRHQAGRHPFYLQLLGQHLVNGRRFGMSRPEALDTFQDEANEHLNDLWQHLSQVERRDLERACLQGETVDRKSLHRRGLLVDGRPFGQVLIEFLEERL